MSSFGRKNEFHLSRSQHDFRNFNFSLNRYNAADIGEDGDGGGGGGDDTGNGNNVGPTLPLSVMSFSIWLIHNDYMGMLFRI